MAIMMLFIIMMMLAIMSITVVVSRIICFGLIYLLKNEAADNAADNAEQFGCYDDNCEYDWDVDADGNGERYTDWE